MTFRHLVFRSLCHYWRTGVVVLLGVAVATAVITGSLLVGDSVTGSLRDTALARLGSIEYALAASAWFRATLARDLAAHPALRDVFHAGDALILARGSAQAMGSDAIVPAVQVVGMGPGFRACFISRKTGWESPLPKLDGRRAAVNAALARDLHLQVGDYLLVSVGQASPVAADTLFARRKREDASRALRVEIAAILPDGSAGDFSLETGSGRPRNVFLAREWLADALGKPGRANALVIDPGATGRVPESLRQALADACTLEDYGLSLIADAAGGRLVLRSRGILLDGAQQQAARATVAQEGGMLEPVSVYLATAITDAGSGRSIAYAVLAGRDRASLEREEIRLNQWAADDLGAKIGDRIEVRYLAPLADGSYRQRSTRLRVRGIDPLVPHDRLLAPDFDGISGAERIDEWDTPFPVDMTRITARDEAYWERFRATPKAVVSLAAAAAMWRDGAAGEGDGITTLLAVPPPGRSLSDYRNAFARQLLRQLAVGRGALAFRPVRQQALDAAAGTTDFGQLFLAMSCFLVIAAAGLAGMLMRLMAERRAGTAGLLLACGFSPATVARTIIAEGAVLTAGGALLGLPLGILYTRMIVHLLATRWAGAVGDAALWLHVTPASLCAGGVAGMLVGGLALAWGGRQLGTGRILSLLAGSHDETRLSLPEDGRRVSPALAIALPAVLAAAVVALAAAGRGVTPEIAFFAGGALLLFAGVQGCRTLLRHAGVRRIARPSYLALALRSAAANRGRSLLVIVLLASAAFIIVAVAANARNLARGDWTARESGAGGFALRAVSSVPLPADFGTPAGRRNLDFPPASEPAFAGAEVISCLLSPGDDISCLNIARPAAPRLLGIDRRMVARGGFALVTARRTPHPWELLETPMADGAIPAFVDADSARWTLHVGLGRTCTVSDERGHSATVRIVGVMPGSIFAGEILVSAANFRRLYPSVSAPRLFLIACPPGKAGAVADALRAALGDLGLEVRTTGEVLNRYASVQNTYLTTFLALGGLGLLLGVAGMVMVLLRGALERRREFALLQAVGCSRRALAWLLLLENGLLLVVGIALGAAVALVAAIPQLRLPVSGVSWPALTGILAAMLLTGLGSCALAAATAVRGSIVTALREE